MSELGGWCVWLDRSECGESMTPEGALAGLHNSTFNTTDDNDRQCHLMAKVESD